ncbi:hypothetical protein EWZ69_05005 [Helicobacter pylori]|nr:hypothetical protein [Helicobacter pylori]OPG41496.1 hypothetical protein BGL74_00505 [Helicobacter pylori]OPG53406.1 hypothetical protein BGL71_01705 [Helicobacter pylori]QEF41429.1 hypothetical protein D2C73_00115 [Helicobacter pylori]
MVVWFVIKRIFSLDLFVTKTVLKEMRLFEWGVAIKRGFLTLVVWFGCFWFVYKKDFSLDLL